MEYIFETELDVRDYECDIQGIVNNAVYQNYFEHARHKFLLAAGISFAKLHAEQIDPVVYRIEIDYKFPLKSSDGFICKVNYEKKGNVRIIFNQAIYRKPDNKFIAAAKVIVVVLKNGKPVAPDFLVEAFEKYKNKYPES